MSSPLVCTRYDFSSGFSSAKACGAPATHVAYDGSKPLCGAHAEELKAALADPDTLGNVLAGCPRSPEEIQLLVRPLA